MSKVFNIALIASAVLTAAGSFSMGRVYQMNAEQADAQAKWDYVMVVNSAGTLIPNPSAMTGEELADSQIIPMRPRLIGHQCEDMPAGRVVVAWEEDQLPPCREINALR